MTYRTCRAHELPVYHEGQACPRCTEAAIKKAMIAYQDGIRKEAERQEAAAVDEACNP